MPYPTGMTTAALDRHNGRDDDGDERLYIEGALKLLDTAAERLRCCEDADAALRAACYDASKEIEAISARIWSRLA